MTTSIHYNIYHMSKHNDEVKLKNTYISYTARGDHFGFVWYALCPSRSLHIPFGSILLFSSFLFSMRAKTIYHSMAEHKYINKSEHNVFWYDISEPQRLYYKNLIYIYINTCTRMSKRLAITHTYISTARRWLSTAHATNVKLYSVQT